MFELEGLHRADAAIVGGTLTGLLLGAALAQAGMRVCIIDANTTENCPETAEATLLNGAAFFRIEAFHGLSAARQHAEALFGHLHTLLEAPHAYVQTTSAYEYARQSEDVPQLEARLALYSRLQIPVCLAPDSGGCPFPVELSLMASSQILVHLAGWKAALRASILRQRGRIFYHSHVIGFERSRVCTQRGCLDAPHIILTAGSPPGLRDKSLLSLLETHLTSPCSLTGGYPLHSLYRDVRGQFALYPAQQAAIVSWDTGRLGTAGQCSLQHLEQALLMRLPDWQLGAMQFQTDVRCLDGLPLIGMQHGSGVLFSAGEEGVLGAMLSAGILARRILGHTRPEDSLYSPDRTVPRRFLYRNTLRYAVNTLRRRAPVCSHCGCRLHYCTSARLWGCPFCGTVYDMLGRVQNGPGLHAAHISVRQRPDI